MTNYAHQVDIDIFI
jgi:hypothetical protein